MVGLFTDPVALETLISTLEHAARFCSQAPDGLDFAPRIVFTGSVLKRRTGWISRPGSCSPVLFSSAGRAGFR
ncbi:hypothetical protein ACFVIZ_17565, partial [Streptomyces anulatus]|uniref:hypothetical protein n=1 Tax=Streptomyces anulatus TaxID=1892 RepID=UPI00363D3A1F